MRLKKTQPPFRTRILATHSEPNEADETQLLELFPASYRLDDHQVTTPRLDDTAWLEQDLTPKRLNEIDASLWVAGRPIPPRPLHYQILVGRDIAVCEDVDMHLVWTAGKIYLKPLPRYLLEPFFWHRFLCCRPDCVCVSHEGAQGNGQHECAQRSLRGCAMGLIFSYVALTRHESDFIIAKEGRLLPDQVEWAGWRTLVQELDTERMYTEVNKRYFYGELRLSRLNKIYAIAKFEILRGYFRRWDRYESFFQDNLTLVASATVFVAVILTAMQVGLATDRLASNESFHRASYNFAVFAIFGPLVAMGLIFVVFLYMILSNWLITDRLWKKRLREVQGQAATVEH